MSLLDNIKSSLKTFFSDPLGIQQEEAQAEAQTLNAIKNKDIVTQKQIQDTNINQKQHEIGRAINMANPFTNVASFAKTAMDAIKGIGKGYNLIVENTKSDETKKLEALEKNTPFNKFKQDAADSEKTKARSDARIGTAMTMKEQLEAQQKDYEERLAKVPVYSADYKNIENKLKDTKVSLTSIYNILDSETTKIQNLNKQKEITEKQQGPMSAYFGDSKKRDTFFNQTFAPTLQNTDPKDRIDTESTNAGLLGGSSFMKEMEQNAKSMAVAGYDYDDYWLKPEIVQGTKDVIEITKNIVKKHYTDVLDENGNIDPEKLEAKLVKDPEYINLVDKTNTIIRKENTDSRNLEFAKRKDATNTYVGDFFMNVGWGKDQAAEWVKNKTRDMSIERAKEDVGLDEITTGEKRSRATIGSPYEAWRMLNSDEAIKLPTEVSNIVFDTTGSKKRHDSAINFIADDPYRTVSFLVETPLLFAGGGAGLVSKAGTLERIGGAINTAEKASLLTRTNILRRLAGGAEEMILGLPFNTTIDSASMETNPLQNLGLDFAGGMIGKGIKLGGTDEIMYDILKKPGKDEQASILGEYFGKLFNEEDLKEPEKLYDKITTILKTDKDNILKSLNAKYVNEAIDNIESTDGIENLIETQKLLTKNGTALGETATNSYKQIEENLNKYKALTDAEKKSEEGLKIFDEIKTTLKDIGNSMSAETIAKVQNLKIQNTLDNNLFSTINETLLNSGLSKEDAVASAMEIVMGGNKTVNGVLKSLAITNPNLAADLSNLSGLEKLINKANDFKNSYRGKDMIGSALDNLTESFKADSEFSKLDAKQKSNIKYLDQIDNAAEVKFIGGIHKNFVKNLSSGNIAKGMSNIGSMIKNLLTNTGDFWKKSFDSIVDDVYESMAKENKDKLIGDFIDDKYKGDPKAYFKNMVDEYVSADGTRKLEILKTNESNGNKFLNFYLEDLNEGVLDVVEAASTLGGKGVFEITTEMGIENASKELMLGKTTEDIIKSFGPSGPSRYQYTLIRGVAGNGVNRIPALKEVAGKIKKAIDNGSDIANIPASYFNIEGQELLTKVFGEVDGFNKIFTKSFENAIEETRQVDEVISMFTVDGKITPKIIVNGQELDFLDAIKGLDMRLTGQLGSVGGGIVESQFMVMTKYLFQDANGSTEFLEAYSRGLDKMFGDTDYSIMLNGKLSELYGDTMTLGQKYSKLIQDIKNKMVGGAIDEVAANSMTHAMIYNPQEYLDALTRIPSDQIIDTTTDVLLRRHGDQWFTNGEIKVLQQKIAPMSVYDPKLYWSAGLDEQRLRNANAQRIEKFMADEFVASNGFSMSKTNFDQYRYDVAGYFIVQPRAGFTSNMNQTVKGDIDITLKSITDGVMSVEKQTKFLDDSSVLLRDIFSTLENKDFVKADELINGYKDFLKKNSASNIDIDIMLDSLSENIKQKKRLAGNAVYQQKFFDFINGGKTEVTKQDLESAVDIIERKKASIEALSEMDKNATENFYNNELLRLDNLGGGGRRLVELLNAKGIDLGSDEAAEIMEGLGLSKKSIAGLQKGQFLSEQEVIDTMYELMGQGRLSLNEAMKNKTFRDMVQNSLEKSNENITKGKVWSLDAAGRFYAKDKSKLPTFFKAFASLNILAKNDQEINNIVSDIVNGEMKSVYSPTLPGFDGLGKVNIKTYQKEFRDGFQKLLRESKIDSKEYSDILDQVLNNQATYWKSIGYKGDNVEAGKVYDYLNSYLSDMRGFRGEGLPTNIGNELKDSLFGRFGDDTITKTLWSGAYRKNAINRLTGKWTLLKNGQIDALARKVGTPESKLFKSTISNRLKDLVYGGIADTGILRKAGNFTTRVAMNVLFGPQAITKAPQQIINNYLHAKGHLSAFGYDENMLQGIEKILFSEIDSKISTAVMKDVTRGYDEGGNIAERVLKMFEKDLNTMNIADTANMNQAKKVALSDGFYDIFAEGGQQAVVKFSKKINDMDGFLTQYGLKNSDFFHKADAMSTIQKYCNENGLNFADEMVKFDELSSFYKGEYAQYRNRVRSSYWLYYASEQIPELGSIGIIDNHRSIFALKKRAFSKFTGYSYDIYSEIKRLGFKEFALKAVKGDIPIMTQIAKEITEGMRLAWAIDRATDEEIDFRTAAQYMIVPATVLMMGLGDAIEGGLYTRGNIYGVGKDVEGVSKTELWTKSIGMGLLDFTQSILSTAWLYNYAAYKPVVTGIMTSKETGTLEAGVNAMVKALFVKPFTKFFGSNYGGYDIYSDFDGNILTNTLETTLNIQSTTRKEQQNSISRMFAADYLGDGGWSKFLGNLVKDTFRNTFVTGQMSADYGILNSRINDYKKDNKTGLFYDEFAADRDLEGLTNLQDRYNKAMFYKKFAASPEGKSYMVAEGITMEELEKMDFNQVFNKAVERGAVSIDSPIFKDTVSALNGTLGVTEGVKNASYLAIPEEDRNKMEVMAYEMFVKYSKANKDLPVDFAEKFINAAKGLGTNYVLAGYMTAMSKGINKRLKEQYGISDGRINFGTDSEEVSNGSFVPGIGKRDTQKDAEYVRDMWKYQKLILDYVQPIIGKNDMIGMSLEKNLIENDPDRPINTYTPKMQTIQEQETFMTSLRDDGYLSDNVMSLNNMQYVSIMKRLEQTDKSDDQKKITYQAMNNATIMQIDTINQVVKNPYQNVISKMGLTFGISPFIKELNRLDSEGLKQVVAGLGKGFIGMVDSLTSANPTDVQTAFEMASGINTHKGSGGDKAVKAKKNAEKLFKAHTEAVKLAQNLRASGYDISPTKNTFGIQKTKMDDVELEEVKIENIKLPAPKIELPKGGSAKTEDLKVSMRTISRSSTKSSKPKKIKKFKSQKKL